MIIDVHIHLWERSRHWTGSATPLVSYGKVDYGTGPRRWMPPGFIDGTSTAEFAVEYMDMIGVDHAFIVQEHMDGFMNDCVAKAVAKYPTKFTGFALLNFGKKTVAEDMERLVKEKGLRGLKIPLSGVTKFAPDFTLECPAAMAVWDVCTALDVPVWIHGHAGREGAKELESLARAVPKMKIAVCHMGLPPRRGWKDQVKLAKMKNVFIDCSGLTALYGSEGYPYPAAQRAIRWAVDAVGAGNLMWGTDYPRILNMCTYQQSLDLFAVKCRFLTGRQKDLILGETARRVMELG